MSLVVDGVGKCVVAMLGVAGDHGACVHAFSEPERWLIVHAFASITSFNARNVCHIEVFAMIIMRLAWMGISLAGRRCSA